MEDIDAAFSQTLNRESEDEEDPKKKKDEHKPPPPTTSRITLSGLLNALDGVAAQEGRILFATTNKYNSLDPALCRPGRMDLHIEFKLASKYQAQELYRCFYIPDADEQDEKEKEKDTTEKPTKDKTASDSGYSSADEKHASLPSPSDTVPRSEPVKLGASSHRHRGPKLSADQVGELSAKFAEVIPEREFSMASLQGYLMGYKIRPHDAIMDAPAWIERERADVLAKKALKARKVTEVHQETKVES